MNTRKVSDRHEKAVAKALGGTQTSNSGATPFTKGDVIVGEMLLECKTKMREAQSFAVQKSWLDDLEEERRGMGKFASAVAISFDSGKNSYYIINEALMKTLLLAMGE